MIPAGGLLATMPGDPTKEKHMSTKEPRAPVVFRLGFLILLAATVLLAAEFRDDIRRYLKIVSM